MILAAALAVEGLGAHVVHAQSIADYKQFYRLMRINAAERLTFCYPTETQASDPVAYGVERDSAGRPVRVTRFRFGNPDTRSPWATMRIDYAAYETINTIVERRTYFNASGMPVTLVNTYAEEVYRHGDGELVQRKLVDKAGKPVIDTAGVYRAYFKPDAPGTMIEEWSFSNGKLHYGGGSDGDLRPFAPMPPQTYFRKFAIDEGGNLLREEIWNFDKKPIPFPGGEYVHHYELNECGQATKMIYAGIDDKPATDSNGVAFITYSYDDAGRMTSWSAFDASGSPRSRYADGTAAMKFTYRGFDGVLVKEERFDAKGKAIAE
jgi:hypothetical protein